jgi:16S rRNA A1518/A1519 N6-dimethyltransferase RsmA/KsgA/DIM1 with predicted DNA glycosylase/AP lyase activity
VKNSFAKKLFDLAIPKKENPIRVLEIGPGDGNIASLSRGHNFEYTGIEGSREVFNSLRKEGYNVIHPTSYNFSWRGA